jgi:hypothetical protein
LVWPYEKRRRRGERRSLSVGRVALQRDGVRLAARPSLTLSRGSGSTTLRFAYGEALETVWEMEPHTQAKHDILSGYLSAWLPIMSKYNERLVYVDGFAGPGVYTNGEPGSPIIFGHSWITYSES